jgi:hypothetical protein
MAPFDRIIVLDFETAWSSKDYTLKKLTTSSTSSVVSGISMMHII